MRFVGFVAAVAVGWWSAACTRPNPAFCDEQTPCVSGTCVDGTCVEPDGGTSTPDGGVECTTNPDCTDPAAAVCAAGQCRPCAAAGECADRTDGRNVCDLDTRTCVACDIDADCPDEMPVCGMDKTCGPCSSDATCEGRPQTADVGVCLAGACPGPSQVAIVDDDCPPSPRDGSPERPFCELNEAFSAAAGKKIIVRAGNYPPALVTTGAWTIIGKPGARLNQGGPDVARIEMQGTNVDVTVRGLEISGANGVNGRGVFCRTGARCTLERLDVHDNTTGVFADNAILLDLRRSAVHHNAGGGIRTTLTDFSIVNNLIWSNGTVLSQTGGARLGVGQSPTGPRVFKHNTVFHNHTVLGMTGIAAGAICSSATALVGNIFWDNDGDEVTAMCDVQYSVIDDPALGTGTNSKDDPKFESYDVDTPDLHLKDPDSPCRDRVEVQDGPPVDYFGQARTDGRPDCGADEYGLP